MNVDGFLNFNTNVNTTGFVKGISGIKEKLGGIKSAVSKFGSAIAVAFSAAAIVSFGKSAIESAAEINASNSQMEQTFGSLYNAADEAMKRVAETSGIVQTRLQGVGTSIYAFAKTSGMDSASALNMMEEALQVTADSAAYYDRSLEETSESLQSFLKGNFENDAALGLSCTETTRNTAANKLYGKSFIQLSESQKQLTLLQMVKDANALSGALGQASRESEGWENVTGNLKEAWKQFLAVVGQPILNVAVSAVKQLTDALTFLADKARSTISTMSELFGWETDDSETVSENISTSVEEQNALTESVEETAETQKKSLAGFDEINTLTEKNTKSAETSENNVEEVSVKPSVVADEGKTKQEIDNFADKIQKLIKPIRLAWETNSPELITNIQNAFRNIRELAGSVAKSFEEVWTNSTGELYVGNIITLFSDVFGVIGDISGALKNAWEDDGRGTALIQSYFDRWNAFFDLIHSINKAFHEVWNDGTGEKICANIFEIITNINNTVSDLRQRFTEAWNENGSGVWIFGTILGIINMILGTINKLTRKTSEWAKKLDFSPVLESVAGLFNSLEPLAQNAGDILSGIYEKILLPIGKWTIEKAVPASIDLFSGAIDLLNSVINVFKPFGKWLYDNFLKPVGEWTGGVIVSVIEGIANALKGISDWISEHKTLVQDFLIIVGSIGVAFAFAGIIQTVISAFTAMGGVAGIMTTAMTALSGAFMSLTNPITLICLAIGAIIGIGILLIKHWDEVKAFAIGLWESIQETLCSFFELWEIGWNTITNFTSSVWESIKGFFIGAWNNITEIFGNIGTWFSDRWSNIKNSLSDVGDWFKNMFRKAYTNVTEIFKSIGNWFFDRWSDIKKALHDVSEWFKNIFKNAYTNVTEIFQNIGKWFSERWNDITSALSDIADWFGDKFQQSWDNIIRIFCNIGSWFSERWNDITNVFSVVGDWFSARFADAWNGVKSAFGTVWNFFNDKWESIKSVFSGASHWFGGIFDDVFSAIKYAFSGVGDFFRNTWEDVSNKTKDGVNWLIGRVENGINGIIDGLNWFGFDLPEVMGGGRVGFSIGYVNLPRLATGTVVPTNYGNFLAVLGDNRREPEIVSPLSTIEQAVTNAMKKNGGFGNGEIHVHVELDGREIGRVAVKAVNQDKLRRGG